MSEPYRKFEMTLKLSADSIEALCSQLRHIDFIVSVEGTRKCVSGGYDSGFILEIVEDPNMDHDKWAADLAAYLEQSKQPQPTAPEVTKLGGNNAT